MDRGKATPEASLPLASVENVHGVPAAVEDAQDAYAILQRSMENDVFPVHEGPRTLAQVVPTPAAHRPVREVVEGAFQPFEVARRGRRIV